MPRESDFKQHLCADISGFSLHAAVRCEADDRQALEQLCRYITRPALANERVQTNAAGQVVLKLKTPWRDGGELKIIAAILERPVIEKKSSPTSVCKHVYRLGRRPAARHCKRPDSAEL